MIGPEAYISTVTSEGNAAFFGKYSTYAEATLGVHYTERRLPRRRGRWTGVSSNGVGVPLVPHAPLAGIRPGLPRPTRTAAAAAGRPIAITTASTTRSTPAPTSPGVEDRRSEDQRLPVRSRSRRHRTTRVDACPDVAGVATTDPKTNGCPADRDHDGIPDAIDACPDTAGVANADATKNGCPARS